MKPKPSTTDSSHAHKTQTQTQGPSSYVERRVKDPIQCNPLVHGVRNLVLFSGRLDALRRVFPRPLFQTPPCHGRTYSRHE